ncbi:MAG: hypothetical protein IKJ58_03475 [Akkermansia sp.]|nr:hypothetical protein [Akkermansia sp.]
MKTFWQTKHGPAGVMLTAAAVCALCGCSVEKRLAEMTADVQMSFSQAKEWEQLPIRTISWQQALYMIYNNNIEIQKLNSTIARCEREGMSIYTDMIPGVSYYGYFTKTLSELTGTYRTDDLSSNVNVTFSLPTITNIPYRVYASRANTFAAIKSRELRERELTSRLYSEVRRRDVELRRRALEDSRPNTQPEGSRMLSENTRHLNDSQHWKTIADLLGDYTARWQILPESMPRVNWNTYLPRFDKLDELSACRFAIRLEQAHLAQYGIALQYLPTINAHLYSPSLFSSTGGTYQGTFLGGDDTRLNLNLGYTLDTQLDTWNMYQDRKENYENVQREVQASIMEHKHKLSQLRRSVQDYQSWRSYMEKRIQYQLETPITSAEGLLNRDSLIYDMRMELLNQENSAIESEAAVIIEYGMSGR